MFFNETCWVGCKMVWPLQLLGYSLLQKVNRMLVEKSIWIFNYFVANPNFSVNFFALNLGTSCRICELLIEAPLCCLSLNCLVAVCFCFVDFSLQFLYWIALFFSHHWPVAVELFNFPWGLPSALSSSDWQFALFSSSPSNPRVGGTNVTAALLSKSKINLLRPVRFSGYKSVRILCSCS